MRKFRLLLLIALAAVMLLVTVLTWGSLGSAVMGMCLLSMGGALLFRKFVTNREEDPFRWED